MFGYLLCLFVLCGNVNGNKQEPHCNKFSFEEQLLEKMVRMEIKVENMFNSMTKTQSDVTDLASKVNKELHLVSKERERMKNEMNVHNADTSKKLVDAAMEMEHTVKDFEAKMARVSSDVMNFINITSAFSKEQSVTYIRWGRTTCPNESKLLYEGYASGSHYTHPGGPSNTICLPKDPQHGKIHPGENGNYIYNTEYEDRPRTKSIYGEDMGEQDVPCVVCEATRRTAVLMIPARLECYKGWHLEYSGYLMTTHQSQKRSDMKCVDANPEKIPGQGGNNDGELFYFVEVSGTIPDPPYTRGAELTCAVCTK